MSSHLPSCRADKFHLTIRRFNPIFGAVMKRIAIILFLFALVAQASAAVCSCLSEVDEHSCCKRKVSSERSISAPPCCDSDCTSFAEPDPQNKSTGSYTLKAAGNLESEPSTGFGHAGFQLSHSYSTLKQPHFTNRPAGVPPARVYLRLHSLLI